jgi:hypothetical protein
VRNLASSLVTHPGIDATNGSACREVDLFDFSVIDFVGPRAVRRVNLNAPIAPQRIGDQQLHSGFMCFENRPQPRDYTLHARGIKAGKFERTSHAAASFAPRAVVDHGQAKHHAAGREKNVCRRLLPGKLME